MAAKSRRRQPRHGARADAAAADAHEPGAEPPLKLVVSTAQSIASVGREAWDACALGGEEINPFVSYDFLHALEESGSVVGPAPARGRALRAHAPCRLQRRRQPTAEVAWAWR